MGAILARLAFVSLGVSGPDSLPGSRFVLMLFLVPWLALSVCGYLLLWPEAAVLTAAVASACEALLLIAFSWLVLQIYQKPARWPQTLIALVGVQALITALQLPLAYVSTLKEEPGILAEAAGYGFLAWWLLAMGHIVSRAVDRPPWVGLSLTAGYLVLSLLIHASLLGLFGVTPGPA